MYNKYSVLMSVYYKEKPEFLQQAILSILQQTILTDDFVLVCDGPLTPELDAIIDSFSNKYNDIFHVIRLEKNEGLGKALNEGIKYCKHELVARMDSDDISMPDRCERQLCVFSQMSDVSISSGFVLEFLNSPDKIETRREVPELNDDIIKFAKKRNPFNHPCVMYKKSAVASAGGYIDMYLLEDYFLWVRMLIKGYQGYNLQEPLLYMRAGSDMYLRRGGWRYVKSQVCLFKYLLKERFITKSEFLSSCFIRTLSSMAPNKIRQYVFFSFLRKNE